MTPFACSWSGGKDSCLASHRVDGEIVSLVTMFDESGERSRSHGLRPEVLHAHAEALGLPLQIGHAGWDTYEEVFKGQLRLLKAEGIEDVVFGDIDLLEHREWEERVCREVGVRAHLPLWLGNRRSLVDEFWAEGFSALVVAVQTEKLSSEFLGCEFSPEFVAHCESVGVDANGENGEFHTVVVDGPGFRNRIDLKRREIVEHSGYAALDLAVDKDGVTSCIR